MAITDLLPTTTSVSFHSKKEKIGTTYLPGSTVVLDRATRQLVECDAVRCPYATPVTAYDGVERLVNFAPHFGVTGVMGMLNAYHEKDLTTRQQAMYDFFALGASKAVSRAAFIGSSGVGPFRYSHFDTSVESLQVMVVVVVLV